MIQPIYHETDALLIHPFRPEELDRFGQLSQEIYSILSDEQTLKFIPTKRLRSPEEAEQFLKTMIINYQAGLNYVHFITDKKLNRVIGLIDLISPRVAKEHYRLEDYPFFIEFYLGAFATGCYIMTKILPTVVDSILSQGIPRIGPVINRQNIAARKVLENAQFSYKAPFDLLQDLYELA